MLRYIFFFFSSRRRHTRCGRDWSSDVCSSDLGSKAGSGGHLSELKAWDPVKQAAVWGIKEDLPFLGGAMSTAGGLVFYGNTHGALKGVDAKTGDVLWQFNVGTRILQSPITYAVDGKQFL